MKKLILAVVSLLFAANSLVALGHQPDIFHQTVSLNGIAATVQVVPSGESDFQIHVRFHSNVSPVACLSAYRDLHYQLRDGSGRLIPVGQAALRNKPSEDSGPVNHVISGNQPMNCNRVGEDRLARAFLSALYPELAGGAYTLQISFAPQGGAQQAQFAPIHITIGPT